MNKKNVITKNNVAKVAKFLKESIEWLVEEQQGCCHFNLNSDLALYVGWGDGFDPKDTDIIKEEEIAPNARCCYAIEAAVKVRNDYDCADFEFLNYPWFDSTGDCWDNGISMRPNMTTRDYKSDARWFLATFVAMVNEYNKKNTDLVFYND